jgi:hypothetical protein
MSLLKYREQAQHLDRVASKIESAILFFCRARIQMGANDFTMNDLVKYVLQRVPNTAPDSPSRILRSLKNRGLVSYEVKSRKDSLYRLEECAP